MPIRWLESRYLVAAALVAVSTFPPLCSGQTTAPVPLVQIPGKAALGLKPIKENMWYIVIAEHRGKPIEIKDGSSEDGALLQQNKATGESNQRFQFRQVQSGWYKIVNERSGKSLEVKDSSLTPESSIQQATYTGNENQLFAPVEDSDGSFTFISKVNGYSFDVLGGVNAVGDEIPVGDYPAGKAKNHKFNLVEARVPAPAN